jgi:hypothetical protein
MPELVSISQEPQDERSQYWTAERRAAATPVPFAIDEETFERIMADNPSPESAAETHAPAAPASPPAGDGEARGAACPASRVSSPPTFPYCAIGKIFFTQSGRDWVGSAAAVNHHTLLTAGHCVHVGGGGGWSSWVHFFPYYPYVFAPNYWPDKLWAWDAWINSKDYKFDYAMLHVPVDMQPAIGYLGSLWNAGISGVSWESVGYPAGSPYPGDWMYHTTGANVTGTNPIAMGNNGMTGGCSGGPWLASHAGARRYANSVNSFGYASQPCNMYGPYFDNNYKTMFDAAS